MLILLSVTITTNILAQNIKQNLINIEPNKYKLNIKNIDIIVDKYDNNNYNSIQSAINNANTNSTIYVKKGYYNEIIYINKKINLIGESNKTTIINPTSNKNSYAIKISSENITISNLGIQNKGLGIYTTGIKVNAKNTTIKSCNIFETPVGIAIWTSENTISECKFYKCLDEGIALLGTNNNILNSNLIKNCEFYNNCDGIELQYSSNNKILSCNFYNNTHAGIDSISNLNDNNIILECKFENNKAFGIFFSKSNDNIISRCTFSNDKIMATESINIKIQQCKLNEIYLTDKSTITFDNCSDLKDTNIKMINSNYKILNYDNLKTNLLKLKEKKQSLLLKILQIASILKI